MTASDNEKKDDWDFKIPDIEKEDRLDKKGPARASSDTGIRKLIKRNKEADLKLAFDKVPKRVSRSDTEAYVNKDQHTHGKKDTSTPMLVDRAKAFVVDGLFVVVGYLLSKNERLLDLSFGWIEKGMSTLGLGTLPEDPRIDYLLAAVIFVVFYFLVFIPLLTFTAKSPGKFVAKILVDDIDGGDIGFVRTCFREMLFKPITLLTVFGVLMPFMNPQRRALHDFLSKSIVRKDYNN